MYKAVKYNPAIHHRRSIRLKGYDYSRPGYYFITICCQDRECLFGEIVDKTMNLNDAGKMVEKWYFKLENKFPDIKCHAMVVMPNHFHCIIQNTGTNINVINTPKSNPDPDNAGADPRVCPDDPKKHPDAGNLGEHMDEHLGEHLGEPWGEHVGSDQCGEHVGSPLYRVVQWFKTMTTNEYIRGVKNLGWKPFNGKLWQRNYYERIIRDDRAFIAISKYIVNNPLKWKGN